MNNTMLDNFTVNVRCGDDLPINLYRAKQVRELDRLAIEGHAIPGFTLMRRAGRAVFELLLKCWPELVADDAAEQTITILCGTGNNAGDGYVVATLARQYGVPVKVLQVGDAEKISGDALLARNRALQDGVEVEAFSAESEAREGVLVDALLGTGLSGEVRGDFAVAIGWLNQQGLAVLAVDAPSGLCSDTGRLLGEVVNADATVSFIGLKQGLLTGMGPNVTGDVYYADLAVPVEIFSEVKPASRRLLISQAQANIPTRMPCSHKGLYGHVMIVGGDSGMAGAAMMAAEAAARTGAGLVSCATRSEHVAAMVARCPEVMAQGVVSGQEIEPLLERPSVLVVGPGLGQGPWGEQLLQQAYKRELPLVLDADALNILSAGRVIKNPYRDNWVLTPHPAEAARLLGCSTVEIQEDRFHAVKELQARYGGAVILKGAGSLVATPNQIKGMSDVSLCSYGNAGMATGGMGDVLSGVLGALLAQGLSVTEAARLGVCLHAYAGDIAAADGACGMMATDLIPILRTLMNGGH